uniref:Uncharacterized protein n=1 Tax=Meloidogyne javanica TaxID=6303 RepID=A0A915M7P6_MELJA
MNNNQKDDFNFNKNFRVNNYKSKQQKAQLLQMSNWQRRARSVAPKNKKFQQKREFSKQKERNLNENYSTDFENKLEKEEEEGRELQLNNFVDEPPKEYFRQNGKNETKLIKEKEFISPLQIKSRILNMEFYIEKRIQNILNEKRNKKVFDNSSTKINNNNEVFELITTKNQNNFDNEIVLGKLREEKNVGNENIF